MMSTVSELMAARILNSQINVQTWGNVVINILSFSPSGDGVEDDYPSFQKAIDQIGEDNATLLVSEGIYRIASDLSISSNITIMFLYGSSIKPDSGITVTINGNVVSNEYFRIFDGSAGGTVLPSGTSDWSFCWFGAYADSSNGEANATARNHIMRAYDSAIPRTRILIPPGRYLNSGPKDYTDMFVLYKSQTSIVGGGAANTWIQFGVQLAGDDTDVVGVTILNTRYGLLLDDESDTNYPEFMGKGDDFPRYGETTRAAQGITMSGRALRRDIIDCQTFACTFGVVELDDSGDQYFTNVRIFQSALDGWLIFKSFNTGDDVGNTHLSQCIIEQNSRHNVAIYKTGTFAMSNSKLFNTATGAKESMFIYAANQSDPDATGFEVVRQVWLNNTSLEATTTRSLDITAIADAGSGMIQITFSSPHYIGVGHAFGNITGTTSYNYTGAIVNSIVSDTSIVVKKSTGSFTFGSTETGQYVLPQIDLWMEGAEDSPKRIMHTEIVGGDVNSFVMINLRNVIMSAGETGKQSGYIRKCKAVSAFLPIGFNRNAKVSDTRYFVGFTPWNVDTASELRRSGWYDEYNEGYYADLNGDLARTYDFPNGQWQRVGISQVPKIGTFAEYNHGVAEISRWQAYGQDSAGNKQPYFEMVVSCQTNTDGAEDSAVSFNYPRAGSNISRFVMRRGLYAATATGGDPTVIGACNFTAYYVNGNAGADGTFTTADGKTVTVEKGIIKSIV